MRSCELARLLRAERFAHTVRLVAFADEEPPYFATPPSSMLTDTAPFRNPAYHEASDTPEQLDYDGLTRVTSAVAHVVRALAGA